MKQYLYELSRHGKIICPLCGKKTFVPYINARGEILSPKVGKCDRADKCGYHFTPHEYFADTTSPRPTNIEPIRREKKDVSYIDTDVMRKTICEYGRNKFVRFLDSLLPDFLADIEKVLKAYHVGTTRNGSTIFWQTDSSGKVRSGKVMKYNDNGHRVKSGGAVNWVHAIMKIPDFHLSQCLFGEHLLSGYQGRIAVVESEKTAIIATLLYHDEEGTPLFLATGGCGNLTRERLAVLRGRDIVLFPDNGKYQEWKGKATSFRLLFNSLSTSDFMEHNARDIGDDIADYLIRSIGR